VRIDKWLWAARFYKTRALAAKACEMGRVVANTQNAKPGRIIRTGDVLLVKNDSGDFTVEVRLLMEIRGPAAAAQTMYRETEASIALRLQVEAERKLMMHPEGSRGGKLTTRDRREIGRLRGRS
jgi:ribosome-associated heat shock protein Hsp15